MRRQLYSIAPHGRFLDVLADRILDGTLLSGWDRSGPFWLSDVTIILPTRRARLALAERFADRLGGVALLPDIRTFGGESAEDEPFLPPVDAPAPLPEASRLERRLTLSKLVRQFAERAEGFASPPNAAEVLCLAESLGGLIDDLTIEGVPASRLDTLVPDDLAARWADILKVLGPALHGWPAVLRERGKVDPAAARNDRLVRQAATAGATYGDRPVIAAGSTGSIPATARLLGAIADLPRGALVLPGLDTRLSAAQHETLLSGEAMQSHPQYGLAKLLRALGAGIAEVEELAGTAPRTDLLRAALAPAEETASWSTERNRLDFGQALNGVAVLAAPSADLEARAIALAARDALVRQKTVGIVTRDQTLARRIAVELERHGIVVDDPAGAPLFQSGAGRLARQILAVATSDYGAVDVVALLDNAAVTLGTSRHEVRRAARWLDNALRRVRPLPGLDGLLELARRDEFHDLLARLGAALAPVVGLSGRPLIVARELVEAIAASLVALTTDAEIPGRAEVFAWAAALAEVEEPGAPFPPRELDAVLAALMAGETVPALVHRRDDIAIWGELEARLQTRDLMILAGLNEDVWPPAADPGPWLSRSMRIAIGLEPPERQQGQAAHDFEMGMGSAEVLLAFAERIGTSPALPSRLVQRLEAFVGEPRAQELRARGDHWLMQARAIDATGVPRPAQRPLPNPPADKRPRRLSITEIEPLMRSPYDIYARHVLRLEALEPLGSEPDARDRGTMIHKVLERFVTEGHDVEAADATEIMDRMAGEEFAGLHAIGERRDIWRRRFQRAAAQFLAFERSRDTVVAQRFAERSGEMVFPELDGFVLRGKADRLDLRRDGTYEILDFKTGGVPPSKEMTAFEAPQLLLEAAMLRAGAFAGLVPGDSAALTYIKIGLGPEAFLLFPFRVRSGLSLMAAVDEIEIRLQRHVAEFLLSGTLPMTARIKPRETGGRKPRPGRYDHLARTDEWTLTSGVDDP